MYVKHCTASELLFFLLTARKICHLPNTNETPNIHILSSEIFPSTSTNPSGISFRASCTGWAILILILNRFFVTEQILYLNRFLWPYYQKDLNHITLNHTTLKLSFTNIWSLCCNLWECESFLESNCPDILVLYETNLDDSIVSGNFSVRGYLPLIKNIPLLICMILQFMWKKNFHLHGTYL